MYNLYSVQIKQATFADIPAKTVVAKDAADALEALLADIRYRDPKGKLPKIQSLTLLFENLILAKTL